MQPDEAVAVRLGLGRRVGHPGHWVGAEGNGWRQGIYQLEQEQWRKRMETKPKLHYYREWKTDLQYEDYLDGRDTVARKALTRLRSRTSELRVETLGDGSFSGADSADY